VSRLVAALIVLLPMVTMPLWGTGRTVSTMDAPPPPHYRLARMISGWLPDWMDTSGNGAGWQTVAGNAPHLDQVSFFSFTVDPQTGLLTPPGAGLPPDVLGSQIGWLHTRDVTALATVTLFDNVHPFLTNPDAETTLINQIDHICLRYDFDGVDIDFEDFHDTDPSDASRYTGFLTRLAQDLHQQKDDFEFPRTVVATILATTKRGKFRYTDEQALVDSPVDRIRVMAYDDSDPSSKTAAAGAPLPWVTDVASFYSSLSGPVWKVDLGIPGYAYRWPVDSSTGTTAIGHGLSVTYAKAANLIAAHNATCAWDSASETPYFRYNDGSQDWIAFYENAASWDKKVSTAVLRTSLGGVSEWALGYEDPQVWPTLENRLATAYPVYGAIGLAFARFGGGARFGQPLATVKPDGAFMLGTLNRHTGISQAFEHGTIYYRWEYPRAYAIGADLEREYEKLGGPSGKLGFPVADPVVAANGTITVACEHGDLATNESDDVK